MYALKLNIIMRNIFIILTFLFLTTCTIDSSTTVTDSELDLRNNKIVLITGFIGPEQESSFRERAKQTKYLILDSPGGEIDSAYAISLMVKYNNIITIIPKNGVCESACTLIFQAGKERYASRTSTLMYHGARIDVKTMNAYFEECPIVTDECLEIFNELKTLIKQQTLRMFKILEEHGLKHSVFEIFIKRPIEKDWLKRGNLTGYSDLRFTAEESMQYNIVTHIKEYNIKK